MSLTVIARSGGEAKVESKDAKDASVIRDKRHPHALKWMKAYSDTESWICDLCNKEGNRASFSYHCSACGWDAHKECVKPYVPVDDSELAKTVRDKRHPHPLHLTTGQYLDSKQQVTNWECDVCSKASNDCSYHCVPCGYDLCSKCVQPEKLSDDDAAKQIQKLFRGQSTRKLKLQDSQRKSLNQYCQSYQRTKESARKELKVKGFNPAICEIITDYAEEHNVFVELYQYLPFKFVIDGRQYDAGLGLDMEDVSFNDAQARSEIAKLIGAPVDSICLYEAGSKQSVPPGSYVLSGKRKFYRRGRPYADEQGDVVASIRCDDDSAALSTVATKAAAVSVAGKQLESKTDAEVTAPLAQGSSLARDWSASLCGVAGAPSLSSLSPALRGELARQWTQFALAEHASIASFARVTLQLMAAGAPASLLADTQRAAADEVRHARLCFALASSYAGKPVEPGAFPIASPLQLATDLPAIAAGTASEACFEETLSCFSAAEAAHRCQDPCVRAALSSIVKDEARHAALAWRTLQWAVQQGGQSVAAAVRDAFAKAVEIEAEDAKRTDSKSSAATSTSAAAAAAAAAEFDDESLEACGRLGERGESAVRRLGVLHAVLPWAAALLGESSSTSVEAERAAEELSAAGFAGAAAAVRGVVEGFNKLK